MSSLKPIEIYGRHGPNPAKPRMLVEELGLPFVLNDISFADVKKPEYVKVNPNGRLPAIYDPNEDLTLWESGAIIEYLVEKYDTEHKISFAPGSKEAYLAKQWLFYQVSGQGPYYGQAVWFTKYHPEQIQSAKDRYYNEIKRVTAVLEAHLKTQEKGADGPWMVGGKFSFVDLAFLPWQTISETLMSADLDLSEFTEVAGWVERMNQRPALKTGLDEAVRSK
ncbi:glutathione S-transferas-like protein [Ophiobolus disseminans]|uniref:Glutathione S-transferas-like protein n=1 Tax=Ophiobolus disseminans TaxID=1469910 RepID=A0A6A7A9U8_9PLEO|nr:glutathione S-transferas-like protein [Ophiobolus disseminans]